MSRLNEQEHVAEHEILDKLKSSSGIIRRKGEDQFFNRYSYFVNVTANKHHLSEDNLSDAYSDAVLAAITSIIDHSFQGRSSLKTFLFQIFQNKCIDLLRKKATHRNTVHKTVAIDGLQMYMSDPSQSALEKLIEKAEIDNLKQQLGTLRDKKQRVLILSAEGYSDQEIAIEMNFKTPHVVKTCRLRCIHSLRKLKNAC